MEYWICVFLCGVEEPNWMDLDGTMYLAEVECAVIRLQKPLILLNFFPSPIRIRVPYMKNPNYFTIGSAFGFFIYIKDIAYCSKVQRILLSSGPFLFIYSFCRQCLWNSMLFSDLHFTIRVL